MIKRCMDSWTHFLLTSWASSCLGNCSSLASTNPKDPHPRPFHKLQILSLPSNKLLSSVSSLSSSSRLSSDLLKSSSLLLGLEGRSCAEEVDSSKDIISDLSLPKACRAVGRKKVKIGPKRLPCGSVYARTRVIFIGPESDHWQCLSVTH